MEECKASRTYDLMEINEDLVGKFFANLGLGGFCIVISVFYLIFFDFIDAPRIIYLFLPIVLLTGWALINIIIGRRKMSDIIFEKFNKILFKLEINLIFIIILILLIFSVVFFFPQLILDIFCWIFLIQGVLLCILATTLYIEKVLLLKKRKFSAIGVGRKGAVQYSLPTYNLEDEKKKEDI